MVCSLQPLAEAWNRHPPLQRLGLDLGDGVVVALMKGLSPDMSDKVAYVTHVPSGSQAVLDRDGQVIDRHDGWDDGPDRLDAVLAARPRNTVGECLGV